MNTNQVSGQATASHRLALMYASGLAQKMLFEII